MKKNDINKLTTIDKIALVVVGVCVLLTTLKIEELTKLCIISAPVIFSAIHVKVQINRL